MICLTKQVIFDKIGNRFLLKIFGVNISFSLKSQRGKFIPLGTNCFARTKLVKFGLKQRKKKGELSYPFDLCVTPIKSIAQILANNFEDYFEDSYFDNELNIWKNKKYSIVYWHDKAMEKEKFVTRYKNRIENFKNITKTSKDLIFVTVIFNEKFDSDIYVSIEESLKKYCNNSFKYFVINIVPKCSNISFKTSNLIYREIVEPCENYSNLWSNEQLEKQIKNINDFYKSYINIFKDL